MSKIIFMTFVKIISNQSLLDVIEYIRYLSSPEYVQITNNTKSFFKLLLLLDLFAFVKPFCYLEDLTFKNVLLIRLFQRK